MVNSVLYVKCGKWIHGRCAKVKRVAPRSGRDFVCGKYKKQVDDGLVEPVEELCEEVETVRSFCYLGATRKELVYNSNLGFRATYFAYNFINFRNKTMIFHIQQGVNLFFDFCQ